MARGILIFLCVSIGLGGLAWLNRVDLILSVVKWRTYQQEIAPHREVAWQQGPDQASKLPSERPPNIIYILDTAAGERAIANARHPAAVATELLASDPIGRLGELSWDAELGRQFFALE